MRNSADASYVPCNTLNSTYSDVVRCSHLLGGLEYSDLNELHFAFCMLITLETVDSILEV